MEHFNDWITMKVFGCRFDAVRAVLARTFPRFDHRVRRVADQLSVLVLTGALLAIGVVYARAQVQNQDTFNGSVAARLNAHDGKFDEQAKRIDKVESVVNWAAGGLVANLIAHILTITSNVKRRRDGGDDDDRQRIVTREH